MKKKEKWSYRLLLQKINSSVKRIIYPSSSHQYLFILSPPYCGSTLLTEIIDSSDSSSINNPIGTCEGHRLPEVKSEMFDHPQRWNPDRRMNWNKIKQAWHRYWDPTKPVLVDKSPPNIMRATRIEKFFNPSHFIIFTRNPYAQVESLMSRKKMLPRDAAEFALTCLSHQKENIEQLDAPLILTYEALTNEPKKTLHAIIEHIPELDDIHLPRALKTHNSVAKANQVSNQNEIKIQRLDRATLEKINSVFSKKRRLLNFFGYRIRDDIQSPT